ncbi:MAG: hypothetical protein NVSMB52_01160 [Chloroflexota bacterium]
MPEHCAKLWLSMKSETVVDSPNPTIGAWQAVFRLSVGVVHQKIKDRDAFQVVHVYGAIRMGFNE